MSLTPTAARLAASAAEPGDTPAPRRVREQARDAVALMAFSAASSIGVAAGFLLLSQLSGAGR